jgi:hypothetical protein
MMKGKGSKGKNGKGKACQSMDLLQFFKPKSQVKPITLADRKSDFETPVKKKQKHHLDDEEGTAKVVASSSVSTPLASDTPMGTPRQEENEDEQLRKEFIPHKSTITRLGTPAQTYRRRKRIKNEEEEGGGGKNQEDARVVVDLNRSSTGEVREEEKRSLVEPDSKNNKQHTDTTVRLRQVYLDLGQSNFGHTKCPVCGLLYTVGEPSDEKTHKQFHRKFLQKFSSKNNNLLKPEASSDLLNV